LIRGLGAQRVEIARELTRIATGLGQFLLETIDLFNDRNRKYNLVLFKLEESIGVIKKDISIEDVSPAGGGAGSVIHN
jgi:hypothetical protein